MQLDEAIVKYVLGLLPATNLPAVGVQALEAGYDSPSLRQLAGIGGDDPDVARKLFIRSVQEIGLIVPTPAEAGLCVARAIAGEVLTGAVTPYEGAKRIWDEICTRFPDIAELTPFIGLASEYEDDEQHRDSYSRRIVERCRGLMEMPA